MKRITWFVTVVALAAMCSGIAAAQCANNVNPGGYDLLQTPSGSTDNLSSINLGNVTFQGVPLPSVANVGTADTIVCRITSLTYPISGSGEVLDIQIVALLLQSVGTVICNNAQCGSYYGKPVTVYATINQTDGVIPTTQLPEPDVANISPSTGSMTVFSNNTFNTNGTTIQADLIVVPPGDAVTTTPIFTTPMPSDSISASGSSWTTTAPPGYPNPPSFPPGGFYVNSYASSGLRMVEVVIRGAKFLLYGLAFLLVGIAVQKTRTSVNSGRLNLRPAYLLVLAAIACFLGWKSSSFAFPMVAHAKAVCASPGPVTVWVKEGGTYVQHTIQTAGCTPQSVNYNGNPNY
jgi:hypothetical protein